MFKPEGVYPAMLTPFNEEGKINEEELRRLIDWLIDEGVSGLFPLGSIGEFIHLNFEEKARIMEIAVEQSNGRVPVVPGTAASCASNCIELTRKARDLGCQAVVIAPPYYFPINQEMIEEHYEQVANALPDFPIILYNIPLFATPLSYDVVKRLSRIKNVVGMKDSSGSMVDMMNFMDKVRLIGEDLNILTGREEMLYATLMVGGNGTMSATVGVVPEVMVRIYRAWLEGDIEQARELQFSILLLIRAMWSLPFPLGFKAALEVRGFNMGENKQPLSDAEQFNYLKVKSRIHKILRQLLGEKTVVKTRVEL